MIRLVNPLNFGTTFDGLLLLFEYERQGSYSYILYGTISNCGCYGRKCLSHNIEHIENFTMESHQSPCGFSHKCGSFNDGLLSWIDDLFET